MIWSHLALEVAAIESDPKKRTNQGLIIPLLTFSVVGLISLVAFCVNRRVMTDIYSPRRMLKQGRPPKIARGFLTWIPVVYRSSESFLIGTCGLDSVILLRFFKLGYRLFSILTILCLGILGPVNFYSNPPDLSGVKGYRLEDVILSALSVDNVPDRSPYFRIHLAFTWLVSILTIGFLVRFYRDFVNLKLQYEEYLLIRTNMSKIEMRSVMVFGIPRQ